MKTLDSMGVWYLTPCRNTGTVVDPPGEFAAGRRGRVSKADMTNADRVSVTCTMIITKRTRRKKDSKDGSKNRYIGLAANVPDVDVEWYGKRWGIETGCKILGVARAQDVQPKHRRKEFLLHVCGGGGVQHVGADKRNACHLL